MSTAPAPAPTSAAVPFLSSSHTLAHLLALPPLLLPLSPNLSALHLARLRLLAALPSETTHLVCCSKCGALNVPGWTSSVEVTRGRQPKPPTTFTGGVAPRAKARKKTFNRVKTTCLVCGEVDCRPGSDKKALAAFPTTRRTRKQASELAQTQAAAVVAPPPSRPGSISATSSARGTPTPMEIDPPSLPSPALSSTGGSSYFPPGPPSQPVSALNSPALKHVPLSHPTVQTESGPSSPAPADLSTAAGRKKKAKKSGLQKMLALNKEKEEEARKSKAGGGLMDWMT